MKFFLFTNGPHPFILLSALGIVLGLPGWNLWFFLWISLIPAFWIFEHASNSKQAILQGFWLNFFSSLGIFYWIAHALQHYGHLPSSLSLFGLLIFCCIGQPQWIIASLIFYFRRNQPPSVFKSLGTALFITGIEALMPKMFEDTLGHGLIHAKNLRQIADLGGAQSLTFLLLWFNDSLFECWKQIRSQVSIKHLPKTLWLVGITLTLGWIYGYWRYQSITQSIHETDQHLQAATIQGNIGDFEKVAAERGSVGAAKFVLKTFLSMSHQALQFHPRPDFLVWPETAYPFYFRNPENALERQLEETLEIELEKISLPLFFGGYEQHLGKIYNAFFFLFPKGHLETYRKTHLLYFGEYLPGSQTFPLLKKWFPQVANFAQGQGPQVISLPHPQGSVRFSPMICYEGILPTFSLQSAQKGSQLLINITNDSWFGNTHEPKLHLAVTMFRSLETRLPLLRATNTGISTLILPNGDLSQSTALYTRDILYVKIPIFQKPIQTLIKKLGNWFPITSLILGLLGCFYYMKRDQKII